MRQDIEQLLQTRFKLKANEGEDKVLPLAEAVNRHIRPKMNIHASGWSNALLRQILRRFSGEKPEFTLTANTVGGVVVDLVNQGMVSKLITSNCSSFYPTAKPISLIQKAEQSGALQIENWSSYTLVQRLMAAASGLSFMQTRTAIGTPLAEENPMDCKEIADPFDPSKRLGVVSALEPDVALIHGCVADRYGNTVLSPLFCDGIWGAAASKHGAIVTVERLVDTDYIRDHPYFVQLPGYLVKSVSVVPFGAHPMLMVAEGLDGFEGYSADYDFIHAHVQAAASPEALKSWTRKWVMDCADENDYLRLLGVDKIKMLKGNTGRDIWTHELAAMERGFEAERSPNRIERMVIAAAHKMTETARRRECNLILAGIGPSVLAAQLAWHALQTQGYGIDLIEGFGVLGYAPTPASPFFAHADHVRTAKMLPDIGLNYGVVVAGGHNRCLSALGGAQIDKYGNINNTRIGDRYLIGPGGGGDAVGSREVMIVTEQQKRRLVDKVEFVTCPGSNIKTMVTDMGIFEKLGGDEFVLTQYIPYPEDHTAENAVARIRENCGWELKIASGLVAVGEQINRDELMILRLLDPQGVYLKD